MKTQPKAMERLLREAYNPTYYEQVWRQENYAFGEPWNKAAPAGLENGDFPDWGSIVVRMLKIGESRDIIMNQFLSASKVMAGDPQPEFPSLHTMEGKLRAGAYLARYRGTGYGDGEWANAALACYLEGDAVGRSFIQLGLRTNKISGKQAVHIRHSPTNLTFIDPHEPDPAMARFVAFVKYIPEDTAVALWGEKTFKKYRYTLRDEQSGFGLSSGMSVMRIIEYYDLGIGKSEPTMAIIPHKFGEEPLDIDKNPFDCLPVAWYEHVRFPGMAYPIGRVALQMHVQEALNRREKRANAVSKRGAVDIINASALDEKDMKRWAAGEDIPIKTTGAFEPGKLPWLRIPAEEISQTEFALLERYERKMNTASGQSELSSGNLNPQKRTLGENQLLVQQSAPQMEWSDLQATRMHIRICEKAIKIMRKFDRDPVFVPFEGYQILLNDPEDPNTWMDHMFAQPSECIIGAESLRARDKTRENAERQALLESLAPHVNPAASQIVDPEWFVSQKILATGENDPKSKMVAPPMMPPPGQPGMPVPA